MVQTRNFARKPFSVEAIQVTEKNLEDVADWCGGEIRTQHVSGGDKRYIKVRVHHPISDRQTRAYIGDWVTRSASGHKVYNDNAFTKSFDPVIDNGVPGTETVGQEALV